MKGKELLSSFEAARWATLAEVDAWLRAAGKPSADELERLLGILEAHVGEDPIRFARRMRAFRTLVERAPAKELFRPLVRALGQGPELRPVVLALLPRVNDVSAHDDLCALLGHEDPDVRKVAAQALMQVGGGAAFSRLIAILQDKAAPGRLEALEAAVALGGAKALPGLVSALRHGTPKERVRALELLARPEVARANPAGIRETLRGLFSDPDDEVAARAVEAFAAVCGEDDFFRVVVPGLTSPRVDVVEAAVRALGRFSSPRAVDQLERKLREGPLRIRFAAIDALERMGSQMVVPPLAEALADPELKVRHRAAQALATLGRSGRAELRRAVLWLLRSDKPTVRRLALHVAAHLQDPDAQLWPQLIPVLRDVDWWVRERAVDAIVALAGAEAYSPSIQLLSDPSPLARMYAVAVLERIGGDDARDILRGVARGDDDALVRERAIEALVVMGDRDAWRVLVDLMESDEALEIACLEALEALGAREAAPAVAGRLANGDVEVRLAALSCLDALDDPGQRDALKPLLFDADLRVQDAARALFERWGKARPTGAVASGVGSLDDLLERAVGLQVDRVVLSAGARPIGRQGRAQGVLADVVLSGADLEHLVLPLLGSKHRERLAALETVTVSLTSRPSGTRFRASISLQHGGLAAVFERASTPIVRVEDLGLPDAVATFADWPSGLVLIAGPKEGGKSTTLHALLGRINETSTRHVVALETTLEAVHAPKRSVITQREIGAHAPVLASALSAALREDADVIAIDEVEGFEASRFVVTAAETGHLVIGVLEASSSQAALERLIHAFPEHERDHVRAMLATSLRAVVCQRLLPRKGGGRVAAAEVLVANGAVRNLIRKGKTVQLSSVMTTGQGAGMRTFGLDVQRLLAADLVDESTLAAG